MRYVALLRGINVGGKNKVEMARLRETFTRVGADHVSTYIASGNVVFTHSRPAKTLAGVLERAIEEDFELSIDVLLRDEAAIRVIATAIPPTWTNDETMRTDVLFLWDHVDSRDVMDRLPAREGIDEVEYAPGAIIWRVDRENLTKSGKGRLVGTDLYKAMTTRNCNTVRKLVTMLDQLPAG